MNAIEVKNLSFGYEEESKTINNISFIVPKGSYVSIIGHNGSGKSTLAKLLIGLLKKRDGSILIDGIELNNKTIKDIRNKISLVFQNPDNQFIGATVQDDIAFGLENRCIPNKEMPKIIFEFASMVGMEEFLNKEPSELSGGQKQRVAIAGALALNPNIIIFDEATSMLDPKGKEDVRNLIKKMREDNPNITILSITHNVEDIIESDEVIILNDGVVVAKDKPSNIFNNQELINKYSLKVPFVFELNKKFKELGMNVDSSDVDDYVEALCQLK